MQKRLFDLTPGTRFTYGGAEWVLLDISGLEALSLTAAAELTSPFDRDNKNNWAFSTLRAELNGPFLDTLVQHGASRGAFRPFESDLTADDGCGDYREATDEIALLTCDMYRRFRDLIPVIPENWWTLTPWTCLEKQPQIVRHIEAAGTIQSNCFPNCALGIRPCCRLNVNTPVIVPDDEPAPEDSIEVQSSRAEIPEEASNAVLSALADYPVDLWGAALGAAVASLITSKRKAAEYPKNSGSGG